MGGFLDRPEVRDKLLSEGAICLFDALDHDRLDRVPDVLTRDPESLNRPFAKCLTRAPNPQDWQTPLARMVDRGKTAAVRALLEHGAAVTAGDLDIARAKGLVEIGDLLEERVPKN